MTISRRGLLLSLAPLLRAQDTKFSTDVKVVNVLATVRKDSLAARGKTMTAEEEAAFKQPILDKYACESSAYYSTARMWDDGIIDPVDTRKVLAMGIAASLNAPYPDNAFGVFRM